MVSNYKVLGFVVALEECFISDIFAKKKVIEFRSEDFEERIIRAHISGREIDNIYMIMYQKQNANMCRKYRRSVLNTQNNKKIVGAVAVKGFIVDTIKNVRQFLMSSAELTSQVEYLDMYVKFKNLSDTKKIVAIQLDPNRMFDWRNDPIPVDNPTRYQGYKVIFSPEKINEQYKQVAIKVKRRLER